MTTLITLALCASASGQKLDAMSRIALQQMKQDATSSISEGNSCAKGMKASSLRTANSETIKAVVKLQRGTDVSVLTDHGFSATSLCSDFAIVQTTIDSLSVLSNLEAVERISIAQRKMELMLNHANALTGVDKIHEGFSSKAEDRLGCSDERTTFTGKGVMIGILDNTYSFSGMKGTSMSSPYMAGVAALWLEANPNLSHQEIKEIAMQTAINDDACNEGNHFINEGRQAGAGKIGAYAGLKYILNENEATLIQTPKEKSFLIHTVDSDTFEAYQAGATSMTATLYNIGGKTIRSIKLQGNTIQVNTANMPKGIYLLKVNSDKGIHSQKIAIQ